MSCHELQYLPALQGWSLLGQAWQYIFKATTLFRAMYIRHRRKNHSLPDQATRIAPRRCFEPVTTAPTAKIGQGGVAASSDSAWVKLQITTSSSTAHLPAKGEHQVDPILSREELDALLGSRLNAATSAGNGRLLTALHVAIKSLQTMVDALGEWTTSDLKPCTWADLAALYELAPNASFLLVEARVSGGSLYVLTSTVTACRLDETAAVALETSADESTFVGWRRVVEYMLSDLCLTLLPQESDLTFSPRTLPPRRWSPSSYAYASTPAHELLITTRVWPQDDLANAIYLLLPANTLREISGSEFMVTSDRTVRETTVLEADHQKVCTDAEAEVVPGTENEPQPIAPTAQVHEATEGASTIFSLPPLADIPLSIAILCDTAVLPLRTVATWRPGIQVPVEFKAGENATLFVNGVCVANGRLVCDPAGKLLVEITAIPSGT